MDFGLCQKIANYIMRPPRTTYDPQDLGPKTFLHRSRVYERVDFQVCNKRQLNLQCTLFRERHLLTVRETVVFLHANSSSRLAVKNYLGDLLPFFNVVCLDCAGSGISQGGVVTLGYYEKEDLRVVIEYLKEKYRFSRFILWGRSMGAVTSLLYAAKYRDVVAVVADNAFSDLQETCKQLKDNFIPIFPDFLLSTLLESTQQHITQTINSQHNLDFNLQLLKPKQCVHKITCPVFYIYSEGDKVVNPRHSKCLYELTNYPKRIMSVKGYVYCLQGRDHNGVRDGEIKSRVVDYLLEVVVVGNREKEGGKVRERTNQVEREGTQKVESEGTHKVESRGTQIGEQLETKQQEEEEVVFESPFDTNLRQSILGQRITKCPSTQANQPSDFQRKLSLNLQPKSKPNLKSQTYTRHSTHFSSEVLFSELKEDTYKIETAQITKGKSCLDSCKPVRKRKKIFVGV